MLTIAIRRYFGFQRAVNSLLMNGKIEVDKSQEFAIKYLSNLAVKLGNKSPSSTSSFWNIFSNSKSGAYIYGSVGSGKTMLMDLFYSNVRVKEKSRYHFNQFMLKFHNDLSKMRMENDVEDPTKQLIRKYCKDTSLLCLDEFQVSLM